MGDVLGAPDFRNDIVWTRSDDGDIIGGIGKFNVEGQVPSGPDYPHPDPPSRHTLEGGLRHAPARRARSV